MIKLYATEIIIYKYKDFPGPGLEVVVGNDETAKRPLGDWKKICKFGSHNLSPERCIELIVSVASSYIRKPNPHWDDVFYVGSGKVGYQLTVEEKYWNEFYNAINNFAIPIEDERG